MLTKEQHEELLNKYAEVIVKVGLNLQKGQRLVIENGAARGVPPPARELVYAVTKAAYAAGSRYVEVLWGDEEMLRLRLQHAPADSFDEYPKYFIKGIMDIIGNGGALLSIYANNPDLYNGLNSNRIAALQKTHSENSHEIDALITRNALNWCVAAAAALAWAQKIFPDIPVAEAESKLWEDVFQATRIDQPDPVAAWMNHIQNLTKRAKYMQAKKYSALYYQAPGTNLTVGLPQGHRWIGERTPAGNGVEYTANMPTEETFTLPDRQRADGIVTATYPLSYAGSLIEDFSLTFTNGRITKVHAKKNEAILQRLVDTDEGSTHLGEVALVPASSPIAKRGYLFYNTLFDENASCHLAIGFAFRFTIAGGEELNDEEFMAAGGNLSINHVDFMIGSPQMDIDGIKDDGTREPVFRSGEWAFDV